MEFQNYFFTTPGFDFEGAIFQGCQLKDVINEACFNCPLNQVKTPTFTFLVRHSATVYASINFTFVSAKNCNVVST